MELDVGVPSSSKLKILNGLDWCGVLTWVGVGSGVDLWPERATIGVEARLVGVDALAAFFLLVIWYLAEDTDLLVASGVIPWLLLVWIPPGVRITPVGVVGRSPVVAMEIPVLTTLWLIGVFLLAEIYSINRILGIIIHCEDFGGRFALLSLSWFDSG